MKIKALTPQEVRDDGQDVLYDIERELVVAQINCLLRRYKNDYRIVVNEHHFSSHQLKQAVIERFRNAGWIVDELIASVRISAPWA